MQARWKSALKGFVR